MKLSRRETWLVALLPAVLVVLALSFGRAGSRRRPLADLRAQVRAGGDAAGLRARLVAVDQEVSELQREVDAAREELERLRAGAVFDAGSALREVSSLCRDSGLSLLSTAPEDRGDPAPHLRRAADDAVARLGPAARPRVWRLEVAGDFPAMQRLLDRLATRPGPVIVPLGANLGAQDADGQVLRWELLLWL